MNRSDTIDLISGALAKAQGAYKTLIPNQDCPGGKFANLQAILECVKQPLSDNGLAFYQHIELLDEGSGASLLKTIISHSSGQWISTSARVVAGSTFRETFNAIEAYRRLHALLILGIAPSGNDPLLQDDNGVREFDESMLKALRKPQHAVKKSEFVDVISKEQYDDLMFELEGFEEIAKGIMEFYKISSVADLPKSEYHSTVARIRKIKATHEQYVQNKR